MMFRNVAALLLVTLVANLMPCGAEEKAASPALKQFEALKKLAGDWVEVGADGKPTTTVVSTFRVTAGDNAICETLKPGSDQEMITMYYLDGSDLLMTHYCTLGNQPRMRAEAGKDPQTIAFKFVGSTNLKTPEDHHMHDVTLKLAGPDRIQSEWTSFMDGKPCHEVKFTLARLQK